MARSTQYFGIQVTLVGNAVKNLLTALQAVDANIEGSAHSLQIQADQAVPGTLLVGDASISTTRYGQSLIAAAGPPVVQSVLVFSSGGLMNAIPLGNVYLLSTAAMKVNVLGWSI